MAGYAIAQIQVNDAEAYEGYRTQVGATLEAFGGEFLVRGGEMEVLEGEWAYPRVVVLRFPSVEQAKAWHDSDLYRPLLELRHRVSEGNLIVVEGA